MLGAGVSSRTSKWGHEFELHATLKYQGSMETFEFAVPLDVVRTVLSGLTRRMGCASVVSFLFRPSG